MEKQLFTGIAYNAYFYTIFFKTNTINFILGWNILLLSRDQEFEYLTPPI